jgi:gliding motility-associated-like protein
MLRNLILTTLTLLSLNAYGQATLYSTNFEPAVLDWSITGATSPNSWVKDICAGNGPSEAGSYSFYITQGGPDAGCGPTGQIQYSYTNSVAGINQAIAYTTIDGTCASAIQTTFDYQIQGVVAEDYAELVYSTDGGGSWIAVGSNLSMSGTWTTTTISLPLALNFSTFLLGVRFTYNNATINGVPIAIDNFLVTGTDTVDPTITCPTSMLQPVDASCFAIADDYTKSMVTLGDNCTDSIDIVVTQNITIGSTIPVLPGGSTTIILTAEDETGNTSQCSFTLNIIDDTDPIFTFCPSDTVIYVDNNCNGLIGDYMMAATVSDNCSGPFLFSQSPLPGTTVSGQMVVTPIAITVTDASGNTAQCLLNATTIDSILPTIVCPATQNAYANSACTSVLGDYTSLAVIDDNCVSNASMTVTQSPLSGTPISADQMIILTLTGGIPNTPQTCQFTVELIDTINPNVICPTQNTIYVNSACDALITDYTGSLAWTDNCTASAAQMTFSQTPLPGTLTSTDQTIMLTATDEGGNSTSCSFNQVVLDTISPVMTCPANQTLNMNASCFATIPDYTSLASSVENCSFVFGVTVTQSPTVGTTINGITTIVIEGTDESGNDGTCSFTVTPIDNISPTIVCPAPYTVNTNSGCTYILPNVSSLATGNDNCTPQGSLTYSQSPAIGTALALGAHTITITVFDQVGNSANCSYDLIVMDQTAPNITCPGSQNVSVDANCSGVLGNYTSLVTISDNCSSIPQMTLSQSPVSGSSISGNTQITMTLTDQAGNNSACTFFAVVIDNTDPVLNCPSTYDIAINSSCQYLVPDLSGDVTGTDNCSSFANMTVSQNPVSGSTGGGLTAVLITLTDEQGNSSTCITMMTPIDNEAPTITCPSPAPINNGANCDYTLTNFASTALILDNCPDYSIVQSPAVGTVLQTGTNQIQLEVMDVDGNIAQCTFDLVIFENTAPTITCPANISTCDPVVNYTDPTYNDNCFAFLTQTDATGLSSGSTFPIGITTLTYAVEDSSNNTQTCSFTVQVLEFPSTANILDDTISLCQTNSTLIEADPATSGTGEWTLLSGQTSFNNQFANTTGVNNIGIGTNILVWTISTASCGSSSDTLVLILSQEPLPASTLDTVMACNASSIQLTANVPLYGIGTWTSNSSTTFSDDNLATSTATNLGAGWSQLVWTITNGSCPATSDTMNLFTTPVADIQQQDTAICIENGALVFNATAPITNQTGTWLFISGSGEISDISSSTTSITNPGLGSNLLIYQMSHDDCPTTIDTVAIVASLCDGFNPVFPTVITPNLDGKNDLFVIDFLELVYPNCRVIIFNRWGSVVYESVGYADPWDGTYNGEPLPMGTYFYKIELNDEASKVYNGPISIIQ